MSASPTVDVAGISDAEPVVDAREPDGVAIGMSGTLAGGAVPLPSTVFHILAVDRGTEAMPAPALGREPAEPGLMSRRRTIHGPG